MTEIYFVLRTKPGEVLTMPPVWFWVLGWFLTTVAVVGNGFVIYLITTKRRLHTTTNWFILSLSVADFCFGSSYLPSLFACEIISCKQNVRLASVYLLAFISVANLCVMTLDRYIAIVKPLRYVTVMKLNRVVLLISGAWGLPVLLCLTPRLSWLVVRGAESPPSEKIAFYLVHPLVLEIFPWFVLIWFTSRILLVAQRHSRRQATLTAQLQHNAQHVQLRQNSRRSLEISSAKIIVIVVTVFVICYASDIAFSVCTLFKQCQGLTKPFQLLFRLLWITNSGANPLAYAFLKKDIKRQFKLFFFQPREVKPETFIREKRARDLS